MKETNQYFVKIIQPLQGKTFYHEGHGIHEKDRSRATRFQGHLRALQHLSEVLADMVLSEPVEIRIVAVAEDQPWTLEDILAREG